MSRRAVSAIVAGWLSAGAGVFAVPARGEPVPARADEPAAGEGQSDDTVPVIEVTGERRRPERGVFELTLRRDLLLASPRLQTSEMLSAAPGFFVDHEDGEGLGNDVYLRGFDLSHGSGIELRVGLVPINAPSHVRGQGYADVNFLIPEVVRSIHVLEGPYDPRQGDAAIVGSASFELGAAERGYQTKLSYGSFDQLRLVAVAAPGEDPGSFAAVAFRRTAGFGQRRAARSATGNAQVVLELGQAERLTLFAAAYSADGELPGVVREDHLEAGRIDFHGSYPYFADFQSIRASRVLVSAELRHQRERGLELVLAPFVQFTELRARENYTGVMEVSTLDPSVFARGDLFETNDRETALGMTAFVRPRPLRLGRSSALRVEPGVYVRAGSNTQSKRLLDPRTAAEWDRRLDADVDTLDVGGYLDLDWIVTPELELSGGLRADLLAASVVDRLAPLRADLDPGRADARERRKVAGVAAGPRLTAVYRPEPELSVQASYGEGFRSLPVPYLEHGMSQPFSKVRSVEAGGAATPAPWFSSRVALFQTWVENELVFVAEEGGLDTQNRSIRRGIIGWFVLRPLDQVLISTALSVTDAEYQTRVAGISHRVPNVPPLLLRTDAAWRGRLAGEGRGAVTARFGLGYTFMSGQHLADHVVGPVTHLLNLGAAVRRGPVELGLDVYDALGRENADRADLYVSNWSFEPTQQSAALETHFTAAPPRTFIGSLSAYF